MKPRDVTRRIEVLEKKARPHVPWQESKAHQVFGATKRDRESAMQAMIDAGEAAPDDIFFLIVPSGDQTVRNG